MELQEMRKRGDEYLGFSLSAEFRRAEPPGERLFQARLGRHSRGATASKLGPFDRTQTEQGTDFVEHVNGDAALGATTRRRMRLASIQQRTESHVIQQCRK